MPVLRVDEAVELRGALRQNGPPRESLACPQWREDLVCRLRIQRTGDRVNLDVELELAAQRQVKVWLECNGELLKRWKALYGGFRGPTADPDQLGRFAQELGGSLTGWAGTREELRALHRDDVLQLRIRLEWVDREPAPAPTDNPNFARYLFSPVASDSVVRVDGGRLLIPTHKIVLEQSRYFSYQTSIVRDRRVFSLWDETEADMRGLLTFLYKGHVSAASPWEPSDLEANPEVYLRLAQKFQLPGLKAAAEQTLVDQLEADNVCEAAEAAVKWGLGRLEAEAKALVERVGVSELSYAHLRQRNAAAALLLATPPRFVPHNQ